MKKKMPWKKQLVSGPSCTSIVRSMVIFTMIIHAWTLWKEILKACRGKSKDKIKVLCFPEFQPYIPCVYYSYALITFNSKEKVITFTDWQLKRKGLWDWNLVKYMDVRMVKRFSIWLHFSANKKLNEWKL